MADRVAQSVQDQQKNSVINIWKLYKNCTTFIDLLLFMQLNAWSPSVQSLWKIMHLEAKRIWIGGVTILSWGGVVVWVVGWETTLNWERNNFELGAKRLWIWERNDFELGGQTTLNWKRNEFELGEKLFWIGRPKDFELGAKRIWIGSETTLSWGEMILSLRGETTLSWGETTAIWVIYLRKKISFDVLISVISYTYRIVQAYQSLSETKSLTTGKPP